MLVMHYQEVDDDNGDLTALIPFCSDPCRVQWCRDNGVEYTGWNGAHEGGDYSEYCAECGVIAGVGSDDDACDCQRGNVVVNRFTTETGEICEHGNWLQLPKERISAWT